MLQMLINFRTEAKISWRTTLNVKDANEPDVALTAAEYP